MGKNDDITMGDNGELVSFPAGSRTERPHAADGWDPPRGDARAFDAEQARRRAEAYRRRKDKS